MKVSTDPLQFAQAPPKSLRAVLVYGPNRALVSETIDILKKTMAPKETGEFSVVTITPADLKQTPTRLADEMGEFGFFATKKVIVVRDPAEGVVKSLTEAMTMPDAGHALLIQAEELGPKSALRAWAEKATDAAALPCYQLDGAKLNQFVNAQFQKQGATIASDALSELIYRLGNDLTPLKNIVTQLIDYSGSDKPVIKIDHVEALLVDRAEHELDVSTAAIADSDPAAFDRALHAMYEGKSMIAVLRAAQNYFYKLRGVHADMKNGTNQEDALRKLRPPLFFKTKPSFIRHLRLWPIKRIDRALSELLYLESMCKKTGTPEMALIQQRLTALMLSKAA